MAQTSLVIQFISVILLGTVWMSDTQVPEWRWERNDTLTVKPFPNDLAKDLYIGAAIMKLEDYYRTKYSSQYNVTLVSCKHLDAHENSFSFNCFVHYTAEASDLPRKKRQIDDFNFAFDFTDFSSVLEQQINELLNETKSNKTTFTDVLNKANHEVSNTKTNGASALEGAAKMFPSTSLDQLYAQYNQSIEVDLCAEQRHNCDPNALCAYSSGVILCTCKDGFTGNGYQGNCTAMSCSDLPSISNGHPSPGPYPYSTTVQYTCEEGFYLDGEEELQCAYNSSSGAVNWNKPPPDCFAGILCPDKSLICDRFASCEFNNTIENLQCICKPNYRGNGINCQEVDLCAEMQHNCNINADCAYSSGVVTCTCMEGFTGYGTHCTDVDECKTQPTKCPTNAECINTVGSFTCTCTSGFMSVGMQCQDVDECASVDNNPCNARQQCDNTRGSFECSCKSGYTGKDCTDIDECASNTSNCHTDATCTNTLGSFNCNCLDGFRGNGIHCQAMNSPDSPTVNNDRLPPIDFPPGNCSTHLTTVLMRGESTANVKVSVNGNEAMLSLPAGVYHLSSKQQSATNCSVIINILTLDDLPKRLIFSASYRVVSCSIPIGLTKHVAQSTAQQRFSQLKELCDCDVMGKPSLLCDNNTVSISWSTSLTVSKDMLLYKTSALKRNILEAQTARLSSFMDITIISNNPMIVPPTYDANGMAISMQFITVCPESMNVNPDCIKG